MKRALTLLLALCLLLCLAACSDGGGSAIPGITIPDITAPKTEAPAATAPAAQTSETGARATEAPATEPPATEPPATAPAGTVLIRGRQSDDAYVNETLNLRIPKPEGWVFYTDEQIAKINNLTAELMKDADIAELVRQNGQFLDMMMIDADGNNINLMIQPKNSMLDPYTDEQVFTLSEEAFAAQFQAAGMEVLTYETVSARMGGQDRSVLHLVLTIRDAQVDEYQVWFRDVSDYMGIMTLTLTNGGDPAAILEGITSYQ